MCNPGRPVQRHIGVTVAANTLLVAHGLGKSLAERDAHIFHRVVAIDVQIALGIDIEIDQAVAGDLVQHVVKKTDAGGQFGRTTAVQVDADGDLRFCGVALYLRLAIANDG
jgi:hypothetical protein